MAFKVPTFNLVCEIYTFGDYGTNPPRLIDVPCQWRAPAKLTALSGVVAGFFSFTSTEILLPKGTDVRGYDEGATGEYDTVVLIGPTPPDPPFASPLPFIAPFVYDVAKGFTNEYRVAIVDKFRPWPIPIP